MTSYFTKQLSNCPVARKTNIYIDCAVCSQGSVILSPIFSLRLTQARLSIKLVPNEARLRFVNC